MVKLVFVLVFIIFVNLTPGKAWETYLLYFLYLMIIIFTSKIRLSDIFKRTLISIPFILAAIPLLFTGQPPIERIPLFLGIEINISMEGLQKFLSIAINSILSIQAAVLLILTTLPPEIFFALEKIKIPNLFISIINLAYHYLFVIREEVMRMIRARTSRSSSIFNQKISGGSLWWRAKVTGGMAGSILIRSIERSDRVYTAMLSRGYNGKSVLSIHNSGIIKKNDYFIMIIVICLVLIIWVYSLLTIG